MKEWCEHCKLLNHNRDISFMGILMPCSKTVNNAFKMCPECGAKRPEESKELCQRLRATSILCGLRLTGDEASQLAEIAIKAVKEKVQELRRDGKWDAIYYTEFFKELDSLL